MEVEQWRRTQQVNVEGTFLTARTWLRQLRDFSQTGKQEELENVGLIIVGSESGHFGERGNADYASGKSAVQFGLVRSLMGDAVRVWPNARRAGWMHSDLSKR
jgi:NAD(P)-dependent dehydrogenase (short-subunit alcohol dehydrogenase family)